MMEAEPDEIGGANPISFRQAQRNFAKLGAKTEAVLGYVRPPNAGDVRDPQWKPLD
jgi:hypothetical protein